MKGRHHISVAVALLLLAAGQVVAADKVLTERFVRKLPLAFDGSFSVENPYGWVEVTGTDEPALEVTVVKTVRGANDQAIAQGRQLTQVLFAGNPKGLALKTMAPDPTGRNWSSSTDYAIKVPRTVHVTILSHSGERIRVAGIRGNVRIKNFSGPITLSGVTGPISVDTVNGSIFANFDAPPRANADYVSVNGHIELRVPANSYFNWEAETLQGDILSTIPVHITQRNNDNSFRAIVNRASGPTIRTSSVMGRVYLMGGKALRATARSIRAPRRNDVQATAKNQDTSEALEGLVGRVLLDAPTASRFAVQHNAYNGDFTFRTNLGNVFVGEIRGNADIYTQAGEIVLGTVMGTCEALSGGGPLNLGDVFGVLSGKTSAGNVMVRAARKGGFVSTEGGTIEVLYSGGPIRMYSGGGDVTLRQADDDVHAETKSGDISIAFDPGVRSASITASASGGNVILNIPPGFSGEIYAEVTASDDANHIFSEVPGLSIVREKVGTRNQIRATGKMNGGGKRIDLRSAGGDIHIRTRSLPRVVVLNPGR